MGYHENTPTPAPDVAQGNFVVMPAIPGNMARATAHARIPFCPITTPNQANR